MTSEEEFEAFIRQNRDLIERMIDLQRGAVRGFTDSESEAAREVRDRVYDRVDYGRSRAEDAARAFMGMVTDPEVQRHFMNMGMEFMMGMSALMSKAPMPDFMKDGISSTESGFRNAACRSNADCSARTGPKKVDIDISADSDDKGPTDDVFKHVGERFRYGTGRCGSGQGLRGIGGPGRLPFSSSG